jgi:hypothetical protein
MGIEMMRINLIFDFLIYDFLNQIKKSKINNISFEDYTKHFYLNHSFA